MNTLRYQLLNELLEHQNIYLSGEELSNRLKVTRTAIWKHMEELRKDGYEITAAKKKGYKLTGVPDSLSESTILPYLETNSFGKQLHVYDVVDSTQEIAQDLAMKDETLEGTLVIANHQRQGKGRLGRHWFSPPGTGIWMSMILKPDIPFSNAPQLTLLASVAVLQGIQQTVDVNIGIKWPNDLLINQKKVAGILTQLNAETDQIHNIIVGVGINVNQLEQDFPEEIRAIATSLRMETAVEDPMEEIDLENAALIDQPLSLESEEENKIPKLERNKLIINIVKEWEKLYNIYLQCGFAPIKTLWESYSVSLGKAILARTINGTYEGLAKEINEEGVLLLEDNKGNIHKIYSADIEIMS